MCIIYATPKRKVHMTQEVNLMLYMFVELEEKHLMWLRISIWDVIALEGKNHLQDGHLLIVAIIYSVGR